MMSPSYLNEKKFEGALVSEFKRHLDNGIVDLWSMFVHEGKKKKNSSDIPVFIHEVWFLLPFVQGYLIATYKKAGKDPNQTLTSLFKGDAKGSFTRLIGEMGLKKYDLWNNRKGFVLQYA